MCCRVAMSTFTGAPPIPGPSRSRRTLGRSSRRLRDSSTGGPVVHRSSARGPPVPPRSHDARVTHTPTTPPTAPRAARVWTLHTGGTSVDVEVTAHDHDLLRDVLPELATALGQDVSD